MDWAQRAEYYEQCLENALKLMVRVTTGDATVEGMGEWISLNYPEYRDLLPKHLRVLPPTRKK